MLKLAFLLIGPAAFRSRWRFLAAAGVLLLVLALLLAIDFLPLLTWTTYVGLGLAFLASGLASLLETLAGGAARRLGMFKASGAIVAGALFLTAPLQSEWALAGAFTVGFALDGAIRLASAVLFRFPGWRLVALCGAAELLLAALIAAGWPLPDAGNVPLCVGLFVGLSGWLVLRLGVLLRTLEDEAAILMLPVFAGGRGWYDHAPILVGEVAPRAVGEGPLLVRVWTPAGSANTVEKRPVIDRYLIAIGDDGNLSTGHASLEMPPDVYISHYPVDGEALAAQAGIQALHAGRHNDIAGSFQPSYEHEVANWSAADAQVTIERFSPRRLRAFWAGYRQDSTYNLANRNCSTLVAAALDAALEGTLAGPRPWLRLARLLLDPDLWALAMVRSRAVSMTWTPGLVLDYARILKRIVDDAQPRSWMHRLRSFFTKTAAAS